LAFALIERVEKINLMNATTEELKFEEAEMLTKF
jgi:hypothetical protein